jgi:hypothetical protein
MIIWVEVINGVTTGSTTFRTEQILLINDARRPSIHARADRTSILVEGAGASGYTQRWRGGRVVECGGLENRYVGNPGVGGSNPPLSAGAVLSSIS